MHGSIKLIVCDVDGTLLKKGETQLDTGVFKIIDRASEKDIKFAVASGRSYVSLKKLFGAYTEKIMVASFDGALVTCGGQNIFESAITREILLRVSSLINDNKNVSLLAYGMNTVYANVNENSHLARILGDYDKVLPLDMANERIYKIAICGNYHGGADKADIYIKNNRILSPVYSDGFYHEYTAFGTDKGMAVEFLKKYCGATGHNTAVFGDSLNDLPMMKKTKISYAAKGAVPEIKRLARYFAEDVKKEIEKII